jgi:uncharacterized repeat protein (TIGR01451 family)
MLEDHNVAPSLMKTLAPRIRNFRIRIKATIFVAFLALIFFSSKPATAQNWPRISFSKPIGGFKHPTHLASARDGSGRLFVVEQAGRIRIIKNSTVLTTPFLDITARVGSTTGTKGLLSVAFPPDYAHNQHFYVNYTTSSGNIVVARYGVTSNPDVADASSEQIVLTDGPFPDHYGGELAFGPLDGYLYFGIGTGSGSTPDSLGQDLTVLRGKVLRIDVETGNPPTYTIPPSNPYLGMANARHEIWATGLRNPWRSSFDRQTGDYYIADVGQSMREEVDFQPAASAGGVNYGWNIMEGSLCFDSANCDTTGLTLPVVEYDHSQGCAISGGTVYRAALYSSFQGTYFFGDWCSGRIWGLQPVSGTWQSALLSVTTLSIISFSEDEAGKFWVADYSGGGIYPIVEGPPTPVNLSVSQSDSVDPSPAGNRVTYTIRVKNNGSAMATGVLLTDTMPTGVPFVSVTSDLGSCTRSSGTIACRIYSLSSGASATITLVLQPKAVGTIANTANVTANEPDSDPTDNSSTESTKITAASDVKVTVTDGKTATVAGQKNTYRIKVTNVGPSDVTGLVVRDTFPGTLTGLTFVTTQTGGASGFTASGSGNISDTVTMPAGSVITYAATGTISASATDTISNTATVTVPSGVTDPNLANNSATDQDTITIKADLKVTVTDGKATAIAGQKNTYTIKVTNAGPSNITNAVVSDIFPATFNGVSLTAAQNGGASGFTASGSGNINDTVTMPAGSVITYTATGMISASATGAISNTANVAVPSGVNDPNPANNSATDTDTL